MVAKQGLPEVIEGEQIYLRILETSDANDSYTSWMNDSETTRYLESRWTKFTRQIVEEYVASMRNSNKDILFGIFDRSTRAHIGNIKIGNINRRHLTADIGIIIGDKNQTGKGFGCEAIGLACRYSKEYLGLRKIIAGSYSENPASIKAFLKAGFRELGRMKEHYFFEGSFVDGVLLEKKLE